MRDFQEQCQVHGQQCQVRGQRSKNGFYNKKIRMACIIKQLLDSVFVISGIIKVSVSVISALADNTYLDLDYSGYHKNLIQ